MVNVNLNLSVNTAEFGSIKFGSKKIPYENILVNAMTLGLVKKNKIFYSKAAGLNKPVIYVGSKTGRDGIHGASMASAIFDEKIEEKKQNPEKIETEVKQVSEFEKKELFDPNQIAALIDKSKEQTAETLKKNEKLTQSSVKKTSFTTGLTLSEEDALKAQIFGCWSLPLGLPYQENLLVRIKLRLKPDGTVLRSEILDHARMNMPGQGFYKVLAESALRAIRLCQPLRVPTTGYERWKDMQLNFDAKEMLEG